MCQPGCPGLAEGGEPLCGPGAEHDLLGSLAAWLTGEDLPSGLLVPSSHLPSRRRGRF